MAAEREDPQENVYYTIHPIPVSSTEIIPVVTALDEDGNLVTSEPSFSGPGVVAYRFRPQNTDKEE